MARDASLPNAAERPSRSRLPQNTSISKSTNFPRWGVLPSGNTAFHYQNQAISLAFQRFSAVLQNATDPLVVPVVDDMFEDVRVAPAGTLDMKSPHTTRHRDDNPSSFA
jgi:hypothetical protein